MDFFGPVSQGVPDRGYFADSSVAGPLVDVPATLTVVPPALLEDQQVIRFDDLLRDVPAAVKAGDDQWPDAFYLRGYLVNPQDFRKDGFVDPTTTPAISPTSITWKSSKDPTPCSTGKASRWAPST